jgi:hypothetical protein
MEALLLLIFLALPLASVARHVVLRRRRSALARIGVDLCVIITQHFQVQPCSRCSETEMRLIDISPNARSVHYECLHCGKRMRSGVASQKGLEAADLFTELTDHAAAIAQHHPDGNVEVNVTFSTPATPLPFEQTRRAPIGEAVRSEVWRRDGGRCVECDSNANLEFDHIIPVARGGATSARNLQLLCRGCNAAKGATI